MQLKCTNTHLAQCCSWDVAAQVESTGSRTRYRLLDGIRPHSGSCLTVSEIDNLKRSQQSPKRYLNRHYFAARVSLLTGLFTLQKPPSFALSHRQIRTSLPQLRQRHARVPCGSRGDHPYRQSMAGPSAQLPMLPPSTRLKKLALLPCRRRSILSSRAMSPGLSL